jgi:HEAT repeat protein
MGKKSRILLAIFLVAVLGVITWLVFQPGEPVYEGKPLSVWLEGYDATKPKGAEWEKADEAVRHIGTAAIPTLLRMLKANDNDPRRKLIVWAEKHHLTKPRKHILDFNLNFQAGNCFYVLGPVAKGAVPELIRIYNQHISDWSQSETALALGMIGPASADAVPSLILNVASTNAMTRAQTIFALGAIHAKPELVVPLLTKNLADPDVQSRRSAVNALMMFRGEAKSAVPVIIGLLQDPDRFVRTSARFALRAIDPEAAAKAGVNRNSAPIFPLPNRTERSETVH